MIEAAKRSWRHPEIDVDLTEAEPPEALTRLSEDDLRTLRDILARAAG